MAKNDPPVLRNVDDWSDAILECRSLQHAWQGRTANYSARHRYYLVTMVCQRCGTAKHQELNDSGYILSSWYVYPTGYLSHTGRMSRDDLAVIRLAGLERTGAVTRSQIGPAPRGRRSA